MTSEPPPEPDQHADWEAFYRDYRKPDYIEGFEITSKLGGGMFGLVFRARRMSIGKDYAIKFLKVDDGQVRRAVLSELEQVKYFAQIDHPNLVAIEDRGEVSGIPYLVMAYAGSETLRDKMPVDADGTGRIPNAAEKQVLLRAFLQSCRGLQALHERSLVHFDIKPANVFLKGGVARLGDYGLSKLVTHSRGSLSMGRGTPYYMAPEMLQRRGDERSDIYSLGVMLYELLCGRVPFAGDSEWEVLRKHETAEPELPKFLTATERAVLQRCLQKEPEARFQSVQELILAFGAPTSSAAATWNDVREGDGTPPPPFAPPPLGTKKAASASEENPYKEMADASRKAFKHANVVAREAMREAHEIARKAMRETSESARKVAEEARQKWHRTRAYGVRRWRAWTELCRRKKGKGRGSAQRVAAAIARPVTAKPKQQQASLLRRCAWGVAGLLVMALTLRVVWVAVLMPSGGLRDRSSRAAGQDWPASVTVDIPSPRQVAADTDADARLGKTAALTSLFVPEPLAPLVSLEEPVWARIRIENPSDSKRLLLEHIGKLRQRAPMSPEQRVLAQLPVFQITGKHLGERVIREQIAALKSQRSFSSRLASDIAKKGPVALAMVAESLAELDYTDKSDVEKAKRLHKLLVDATGCRDLDLVTKGSLQHVGEANRALGRLWVWFVNEFAHTERCWFAYKKLLRV